MKLKPYIRKHRPLQEGFAKAYTVIAVHKICKILKQRTGIGIGVSDIPIDIYKYSGEKLTGLVCLLQNGRQLRFNWLTRDTSSTIVSVEYWKKGKIQPDLELDLKDMNVIQIIEAVTAMLQEGEPTELVLTEDVVTPKTQGKVSAEIAESINKWSQDMDISDQDLQDRRLSQLYDQYLYWYKETGLADNMKLVNAITFRNYIIAYLAKYNVTNKFMRKVIVKDAGKEKIVITDEENSQKFDDVIYHMTLADTISFARNSVQMVLQGLSSALIIGGTAGIGKTRLVGEELKNSSKKVVRISGGIKSPEDLYKILYNNNDKNTVLLFDDTDAIFDKKMLDIMKAALAPDRDRYITWYSSKINADKKYKTDLDIAIAKTQGDIVRKSNKKEYDPTFKFESKIIIITNMPKSRINPALLSRGTYIEMVVEPQDILDNIRLNIENILPEYKDVLTTEMKLEVIDFIQKYIHEIHMVDYRIFRTVALYRAIRPESQLWRKWAMVALRAVA